MIVALLLVSGAALVVTGAGAARSTVITITLTASNLAPANGEVVTYTATVAGGTDGDKIRFTKGGNVFATATISAGVATATDAYGSGPFSVQALYIGSSGIPNGVVSNTLMIGAAPPPPPAPTATALTVSPVVGGEATFTATVTSAATGTPTGAVTFYDNGHTMGAAVSLSNGVASLHWGGFAAGSTESFTAQYSGDSAFAASTASAVSVTIPSPPSILTTITVSASPNPVPPGGVATLVAHVFQTNGTAHPPAGKEVSYWNIGTTPAVLIGTAALDSQTGLTAPFQLPSLPPGSTYTLAAKYEGDASFPSAQETITIAYLRDATVIAPSPTIVYGSPLPTLTATYTGLTAQPSTPATCTTPVTATSFPGTYAVTCQGAAEPGYAFRYQAGSLTITKAPLTVKADDVFMTAGSTSTPPAFSATISGFVNGETLATSGVTGAPACTSTVTSSSPAGSYPITCAIGTLASDRYAFTTFTSGTVTVGNTRRLTVTAPSPTIAYGSAIPPLTPAYSGFAPGDTAASLATRPTCTTTATPSSAPGAYPVTCAGGADSRYTFAYTSGTLTISKIAASLILLSPPIAAIGKPVVVTALLFSGLQPIANATVVVSGGGGTCSAKTTSFGIATCTLTPTGPLGPTTLTASFAGNDRYRAATDTNPLVLYTFPKDGCGFVIGDREAHEGDHVTFWGSQWSKENSLSDGDAPSGFKGYAQNGDFRVGGRWTTSSGNSASPPSGPLPSYIGVLVSRSSSKSGSTIGGSIDRIVVVRVDPGYDGNPGHAGTGTIVG